MAALILSSVDGAYITIVFQKLSWDLFFVNDLIQQPGDVAQW